MAHFRLIPLPQWAALKAPRRTPARERLANALYTRIAPVQLVGVVDELLTAPTTRTAEDVALCLAGARDALAANAQDAVSVA